MDRFNAVFEWNMSPQEAQAFKLCVFWEELTKKLFPGLSVARMPERGDPRKSVLFKHCWKLTRETRGLLKSDEEYKLYIAANLQILKVYNARVDPIALCGDKAWIRWKVWKRLYDKKQSEVKGEEVPPSITFSPKIVKELDCTKRFLFEKCEGNPTRERIKQFIEANSMKIWVSTGKVSPYYLVLSPWVGSVAKMDDLEKKFQFDATLYQEKVDENVRDFFLKEFDFEFKGNT